MIHLVTPPTSPSLLPPSTTLCCLVSLCDIQLVVLEIIQACFFSFRDACLRGGTAMGSSSNELPLEQQWVYPWESAHHTRTRVHNHTECTHVRQEFLPASALKQPCQSCLCVTKSHSQRAFYPPRLRGPWHWQGTHAHTHTHTHTHTKAHTQTQSTCLMQCSVTWANRHIWVHETALQCVVSY